MDVDQMPCRLWLVDRELEEEPQTRHRHVERSWGAAIGCKMPLEGAHLLGCRGVGRAAQKGRQQLDRADIAALSSEGEIVHTHVFDHASAQRADGLLEIRGSHQGSPVLRVECLTPRSSRRSTCPVILCLSCGYRRPRSTARRWRRRLPRERVRSLYRNDDCGAFTRIGLVWLHPREECHAFGVLFHSVRCQVWQA